MRAFFDANSCGFVISCPTFPTHHSAGRRFHCRYEDWQFGKIAFQFDRASRKSDSGLGGNAPNGSDNGLHAFGSRSQGIRTLDCDWNEVEVQPQPQFGGRRLVAIPFGNNLPDRRGGQDLRRGRLRKRLGWNQYD